MVGAPVAAAPVVPIALITKFVVDFEDTAVDMEYAVPVAGTIMEKRTLSATTNSRKHGSCAYDVKNLAVALKAAGLLNSDTTVNFWKFIPS